MDCQAAPNAPALYDPPILVGAGGRPASRGETSYPPTRSTPLWFPRKTLIVLALLLPACASSQAAEGPVRASRVPLPAPVPVAVPQPTQVLVPAPMPDPPVVVEEPSAPRTDTMPTAIAPEPPSLPRSEFPSQSWWDAISTCEGGGPGQWRTGYFGIEAGYPVGGLSYDTQLTMAREIFNRAGASAWGCWAAVRGPW